MNSLNIDSNTREVDSCGVLVYNKRIYLWNSKEPVRELAALHHHRLGFTDPEYK
jgi:hypothetical protein